MFAAVKRSQDLSKAGLPLVARHVFAPLSWPLTAAAYRLQISPNAVTAFRAALVLLALVVTAFTLWGLVLFVLAAILDHVDGSLCRMRDKATWFGKFIDGLADMCGDLLLLPALAFHGALPAAAIGTAALALAFLALYRLPLVEMQARVNGWGVGGLLGFVDAHGANAIFDLRYLAFPLVFIGPEVLIAFLASLYVLGGALIVTARTVRAYRSLNIPRKSKSAR